MVDSWFTGFEVKAGEAVYPGTIEMNRIEVKYYRGRPKGAIINLGGKHSTKTFVSYEIKDQSEDVKTRLMEENPDVAERLVHKPPFSLLTADGYRRVQEESYAPDEDGKYPSEEEAAERFKVKIKELLDEHLEP